MRTLTHKDAARSASPGEQHIPSNVTMGSLCRLVAVSASLFAVATAQIRVRLSPSTVNELAEPDFHTWNIENESQNASTTIDSLDLTLSSSADSDLEGNSYKYQYTRPVAHLGERVVNQGITTSRDNPGPITLTIQGLEAGEHTLLTWHNAWDSLDSTATVSVSVDGEDKTSVCR